MTWNLGRAPAAAELGNMSMQILVVEDDELQATSLCMVLEKELPGATTTWVASESDLLQRLSLNELGVPDVIIMDVILRWAIVTEDFQDPPPEVLANGHYTAGIRCLKRLLDRPATSRTPVVVYSVLDRDDISDELSKLPPHVTFLRKGVDDLQLVRVIRSLLPDVPAKPRPREGLGRRLWDALEAKPGWIGITLDLKRLLGRRDQTKAR